jgi:hypothetical protein
MIRWSKPHPTVQTFVTMKATGDSQLLTTTDLQLVADALATVSPDNEHEAARAKMLSTWFGATAQKAREIETSLNAGGSR